MLKSFSYLIIKLWFFLYGPSVNFTHRKSLNIIYPASSAILVVREYFIFFLEIFENSFTNKMFRNIRSYKVIWGDEVKSYLQSDTRHYNNFSDGLLPSYQYQ